MGGGGKTACSLELCDNNPRNSSTESYAPPSPPEWIARLRPQVVLLSVAAGDEQGRPDSQLLQALEGRTLLRTDQNGWIELSMDGEQIWVDVKAK